MTCYTYERFLLQGNEIRFDIVIDFNCDDREALYKRIVQDIQECYPDYRFTTTLDSDISD